MWLFKVKQTKQEELVEKKESNVRELVEEIHETFFTEVNRLLEEANNFKKIETEKAELLSKSERLKKLGFKNYEVQEAEIERERINTLIKENNDKKDLINAINYFSQKYPLYKFITEESVKMICQKYRLIYGDVKYFTGIIPDKNLTKMEEFKITDNDKCYYRYYKYNSGRKSDPYVASYREFSEIETQYRKNFDSTERAYVCPLEIAAPAKDFDLTAMENNGMEIKDYKITNKPIPDPIVLQPVWFNYKKYYLIVTAWGPEASDESVVNERMN